MNSQKAMKDKFAWGLRNASEYYITAPGYPVKGHII